MRRRSSRPGRRCRVAFFTDANFDLTATSAAIDTGNDALAVGSDFLGRGREFALAAGDLLAVMSAGAYGMAMSSNYNTRPRAAEVIIDGTQSHLVRRRESVAELFDSETLLP